MLGISLRDLRLGEWLIRGSPSMAPGSQSSKRPLAITRIGYQSLPFWTKYAAGEMVVFACLRFLTSDQVSPIVIVFSFCGPWPGISYAEIDEMPR